MAGGLAGSPIVDGNGANLKISVPMARPSQTPLYEQLSVQDNTTFGVSNGISPSITPGAVAADHSSAGFQPASTRPMVPVRQTNLTRLSDQLPPISTHFDRAGRQSKTYAPAKSQGIGQVTGSMSYANGDTVLFGSQATVHLDKKNTVRKRALQL
jgi:hypothetical protein